MANQFIFNTDWSSLKWTGSPISDKFSTTSANQEIVLFERENNRILNCTTLTVTADTTDLYFTIIKGSVFMDGSTLRKLNGDAYDFTDAPVFCVPADTSIAFNGLDATGIRFANNLGVKYFVQAIGFFSDDRYESSALTYDFIREMASGTQMRISYSEYDYANLRETANHTSTILKKIKSGTIVNIIDIVIGSYVNGTYLWAVVEYENVTGYVNYNSLMPYGD